MNNINYDSDECNQSFDITIDKTPKSNIIILEQNQNAFEPTDDNKLKNIDHVEYSEPSAYEKKLLEGTITAQELLDKEAKEEQEIQTQEQEEYKHRHMFITMVKVIALVNTNYEPLTNPSTKTTPEKKIIIDEMQRLLDNESYESIKEQFNKICEEQIFTVNADYSQMTINPTLNF